MAKIGHNLKIDPSTWIMEVTINTPRGFGLRMRLAAWLIAAAGYVAGIPVDIEIDESGDPAGAVPAAASNQESK